MKQIIHVHQHRIRSNLKNKTKDPPIIVRNYKMPPQYANEVEIVDDSGKVVAKLVYSPDKPLSCGARVYLCTELEVRITK